MDTITEVEALVVHPLPSVTVTVADKGGCTEMLAVVAPLLQRKLLKLPLTPKVAVFPGQTLLGPLMAAIGAVKILVVKVLVAVHPIASVTVTVKMPAVFTEIASVCAPVFQIYVPNPRLALRVVLPPGQNAVVPPMLTVDRVGTVTVCVAMPVQPLPSVTVTVYVPLVATVSILVLLPLLHL